MVPKYQQVKDDLKERILSEKFENGDRFYTEAELVEMYSVSSITVIRALNELEREGYLVRIQGKGTFISRARKNKLIRFSDVELFPVQDDVVTVLSMTVGDTNKYLHHLGLREDDQYYKIERLRQADNVPYIYQQSYIPQKFIDLTQHTTEDYASIYARFREDFGIHMTEEKFVETNEVAYPTPKRVAKLLGMSENEPTVLQIRKTLSHLNNEVLEYIETYKKWDYFKVKMQSNDL
ncbi:MAG: GntR family transcriptional regulator [Aerococcus sp.]|nr:GntR family transcriptional regulator [Aerococcus sp.]